MFGLPEKERELKRRNGWCSCGKQDKGSSGSHVVQSGPSHFDFLQFPETILAEIIHHEFVVRSGGIGPELTVKLGPS